MPGMKQIGKGVRSLFARHKTKLARLQVYAGLLSNQQVVYNCLGGLQLENGLGILTEANFLLKYKGVT